MLCTVCCTKTVFSLFQHVSMFCIVSTAVCLLIALIKTIIAVLL